MNELGKQLISKGANIHTMTIKYFNRIILLEMKIISNNSRKFKKKNKTPFNIALNNNSKEMIELLLSKGANVNTGTH